MDFDRIIGQKEIIGALKASLSGSRTGHAYIFCGPKGLGKKTTARIFSSLLLCLNAGDGGSCGNCLPCRLFAAEANPDFKEINPEDGTIGVDEIRKIQGDIVVKPFYSRKKVYLVADAERMTVQAQNSLLKTLEEPPSYGVIILTVSSYGALLETVRSRAVKFSFKKNTRDEVEKFLKSRYAYNEDRIKFIASYADGVIGTAKELSESGWFVELREKILEAAIGFGKLKLADVLDFYRFFEEEKDNIDAVLDIILLLYRDLLAYKVTGNENILINYDKKDIILNNAPSFTVRKLLNNIEAVETARRNLKQNANYQLSLEIMLMKLQEEEV